MTYYFPFCYIRRKALEREVENMNPSEFPEVQSYPEIVNFLKFQVDMLFEDLRILLRLPFNNLKAGCNFTATAMLFNIIAGVSVCFYDASIEALNQRRHRGERFEKLLIKYYPWEGENIGPKDGSKLLYKQARNPLAHSLGLDTLPQTQSKSQKTVVLKKGPLTPKEIDELEAAPKRPTWLPQTIVTKSEQIEICVPTLYWGLHRLLHKLFADKEQIENAKDLYKQWTI